MTTRGTDGPRRVSWRQLDDRVRAIASGLSRIGVRKGHRVSLLVPPGPTLTAVVYACLRIGAVVVVADAGLGVRGLTRAVRGSWPDFVIGEAPGLVAARALGWPGVRISAARLPERHAGGARRLAQPRRDRRARRRAARSPRRPEPDDDAAILFTSGSTGPAKGVVYTHAQLSALRDVLASHFDVTADTGLVTGFAPFALLGSRARHAVGDARYGCLVPAHPHGDGRRGRRPRVRRAHRVPLAGRDPERRRHRRRPHARGPRRPRRACSTFLSTGRPDRRGTARVGGRAHAERDAAHPLRHDRVPAGDRRDARRHPRPRRTNPTPACASGSPIGSNRVLISALDADGRATGAPSSDARRARRDRRLGAASQGSLRPAVAHRSRRRARDADTRRGCRGRALASHRRRRAPRRARAACGWRAGCRTCS